MPNIFRTAFILKSNTAVDQFRNTKILDLVKFVMCSLVFREHMFTMEIRVHMINLTVTKIPTGQHISYLQKLIIFDIEPCYFAKSSNAIQNSNCCEWESLGASPIGVYEHCFLHYDNDHLVLIGKYRNTT